MDEIWARIQSRLRSQTTCSGLPTEQFELYLRKQLPTEASEPFEKHLAHCPACRERLVALYRTQRTLAYLQVRVEGARLQYALTLSPNLPGYGTVQISEAPSRTYRYAASSHPTQNHFSLQSISEDGRLLVSLRQTRHRKWQLIARLVPQGTWQQDGERPLLVVDPNADADPTTSGLLCLVLRADTDEVVARLGTPLVQDPTTGHYLAGFELPLNDQATPITIEYGLIPVNALRWLSPEEQQQSHTYALNLAPPHP